MVLSGCTGDVLPSNEQAEPFASPSGAGAGVEPITTSAGGPSEAPTGLVGLTGAESEAPGAFDAADVPVATNSESESPGPDGLTTPPDQGAEPACAGELLAPGIRIREVAIYQTVKIPIVRDGVIERELETPLVPRKSSLVRVFVEATNPSSRPEAVKAVLTLETSLGPQVFETEMAPPARSTDEDPGSTFNFELGGDSLGLDTAFSVALQQTDCSLDVGSAQDARFPQTGSHALPVEDIRKLRVVLVPVTVSGLTPATGPEQLDAIHAAMTAYYPVPDVELSVHEPLVWNETINGTVGWPSLLEEIGALRRRDRADPDVYYYGLVQPTARFSEFCRRGCILGIAPETVFVSAAHQIGLGVGYDNELTLETIVHELGHAHGLGHAPCALGGDIAGVDRSYPYPDGSTRAWGWDARTDQLMSPDSKDVMGYCDPTWISPYNYQKLVDRSGRVNTAARLLTKGRLEAPAWQSIVLDSDGIAHWGKPLVEELPQDAAEAARVLDADGGLVDTVSVWRVPLSEDQGSFIYVPPPKADWATIELSDLTLQLSDIQ